MIIPSNSPAKCRYSVGTLGCGRKLFFAVLLASPQFYSVNPALHSAVDRGLTVCKKPFCLVKKAPQMIDCHLPWDVGASLSPLGSD